MALLLGGIPPLCIDFVLTIFTRSRVERRCRSNKHEGRIGPL